jgi:type II secretory pathway component PulF
MKGGFYTMELSKINKKKGMSIGDMYPAVLTIVLVGIVLGVGLYVLSTFSTQIASDATAQGAVNTTISGLATFADWIAIIVVVIAAAIVLGVVLSSFGQRGTGI